MQVQVTNPADYAMQGEAKPYLVEFNGSVPAWDEMGLGDLCGPFATQAEAQAAINEYRDLGMI